MNNKRMLYFLLPLVVFIWGGIAWRVWRGMSDEPLTPSTSANTTRTAKVIVYGKKPTLLLTYKDPFLLIGRPLIAATDRQAIRNNSLSFSKITKGVETGVRQLNLSIRNAQSPVPPAPVIWPEVKYLGIITQTVSGKQVA